MVNKNIKKLLLFITLCILLIGIVSATDVESNDTTDVTPTISEKTTDTVDTISEVKENVINDNNKEEIKKDTKTEPVKAASQKQTKISIDYVPDISVDESVFVMGTFTDANNNPLRYTHLKLDVNGDSYYTETDDDGFYIGEYFATTAGTKTITVSWAGNTNYAASSAKRTFYVEGQYPTKIVLNSIKDVNLGDTVTISGYYYYDQNKPLKQTTMTLNINGAKYYAKTDNNGYFTYNYKTTKTGTNTITAFYAGNIRFKEATSSKTFNVKSVGPQYTYITLNNIKEVKLGEYTTISGYYYYDQAKPLRQTTMTLNINGAKYYAKTNSNGYFTYNYKTTKTGTNTLTVSYPGNTNFKAATTTKTFNVKNIGPEYTYITLNSIKNVKVGETTTISGYYYYDQAKPLRQTTMTLNINGAKYYAKTNSNGYFTYNYKTIKAGTNNVTVSYPGNTNFKAASTTKTFNVAIVNTSTYLYGISSKEYGDTVYLEGYLKDANYNALKGTGVFLNINGKNYVARTDSYGYFYYNYKVNTVGYNTVTATFNGTKNYAKSSDFSSFYVSPKETYLYVNNISSATIGESVSISGRYTDNDYNPLKATTITININGNKYYAKTDNYGYYSLNYNPQKGGTNNVTVSYPGNERYSGASDNTTFYVYKISTILSLNSISNIIIGDIAQISGRYTDENYNPLKSTAITININGNTYYARTDNYGYYSYNYKTNTLGTNYVEVSYPGNDKYYGDSDSTSFTVTKETYTVELYTYPLLNGFAQTQVQVGKDRFDTWYQTYEGQYDKGVHVEVIGYDENTDTYSAPHVFIMDATFYFKDSNGYIYSDGYSIDYGYQEYLGHKLVSGYTPYKVLVTYRKITSHEQYLLDNGYHYDRNTDTVVY